MCYIFLRTVSTRTGSKYVTLKRKNWKQLDRRHVNIERILDTDFVQMFMI